MRITRTRTAIAAAALGAIAITGTVATGIAGAQGTKGGGGAAKQFASALSVDQRTCLHDNGVVRPGQGATLEQRQAFLARFNDRPGDFVGQEVVRLSTTPVLRDGQLKAGCASAVEPDDPRVVAAIERELPNV